MENYRIFDSELDKLAHPLPQLQGLQRVHLSGGHNAGGLVEAGVQRRHRGLQLTLDDRSRLGFEFHHISNAGIGKENPGSETTLLTYSYPLSGLRAALFGK